MATPRMVPIPPEVEPAKEVEPASAARLNFNVSPAVAEETRQLAASLNISMTQLFKNAMSLYRIAVEESKNNRRKLVLADREGNPLREFILPGLD